MGDTLLGGASAEGPGGSSGAACATAAASSGDGQDRQKADHGDDSGAAGVQGARGRGDDEGACGAAGGPAGATGRAAARSDSGVPGTGYSARRGYPAEAGEDAGGAVRAVAPPAALVARAEAADHLLSQRGGERAAAEAGGEGLPQQLLGVSRRCGFEREPAVRL